MEYTVPIPAGMHLPYGGYAYVDPGYGLVYASSGLGGTAIRCSEECSAKFQHSGRLQKCNEACTAANSSETCRDECKDRFNYWWHRQKCRRACNFAINRTSEAFGGNVGPTDTATIDFAPPPVVDANNDDGATSGDVPWGTVAIVGGVAALLFFAYAWTR